MSSGGGLVLQLVYLPAGLFVAALVLEVIARTRGPKSLHGGVLAILAATFVSAALALAVSESTGQRFGPLTGSPFASRELGIAFACLSLLCCLTKAWYLRFQTETQESGDSAQGKRRGRGRSKGRARGKRRRAASQGFTPGSISAPASHAAYAICFTATLGVLLAGLVRRGAAPSEPAVVENLDPPTDPLPTAIAADEAGSAQPNRPQDEPPSPALSADSRGPAAGPLENIPVQEPTPQPTAEPDPTEVTMQEPAGEPETTIGAVDTTSEPPQATIAEVSETTEMKPPPEMTPPAAPRSTRPASSRRGGLAGAETYKQLIQPILRGRCYDCHGEEKQKGDLRLDTPEHIRLGGKSGPVIIAGDPEKSYLFELISLDESEDDIMPPKGKPLSEAQISWIGGWIREGAALGDGVAWPEAQASDSGDFATDSIAAGVAVADETTIQALMDGGVNVRKLSSDGNLLEIDYSHADRAKGDLRLRELLPIAENIYTLDLKRTKVVDGDLEVLTSLTNLRELHLQRTGITDAALGHLTSLKLLESLNLYSTEVSDAGLPALKQLGSLKKLYLWSSKVTAEGARELAGVLGADVVNMGE